MFTIDLARIVKEARASTDTSWEVGKKARQELNLDERDERHDPVTIEVPTDVSSVSMGLLLGMFQPSVKKFGRDEFLTAYKIHGNPEIESQFLRMVDYSEMEGTTIHATT